MQKNTRNKQEELVQLIALETTENKPDQFKINNAYQQLRDIENYKITESIIRSKEKITLEQTNKLFFDQKNPKQKQKNIN